MDIAFTVKIEGIINMREFEDDGGLDEDLKDYPDVCLDSASARKAWFEKIAALFNQDLDWVVDHAHYKEFELSRVRLT